MMKRTRNAAMGDLFGDSLIASPEDCSQPFSQTAGAAALSTEIETGKAIPPWALQERFLKDSEVAARYGIARQTVWRYAKKGLLPPPIKIANSTRWPLSALLQHERGHTRHLILGSAPGFNNGGKK
jgi:prophage regulatory protein